jgi:hypothetical protein
MLYVIAWLLLGQLSFLAHLWFEPEPFGQRYLVAVILLVLCLGPCGLLWLAVTTLCNRRLQ